MSIIRLTEDFVKNKISEDAPRGFQYIMVWERVLDHVLEGDVVTFDLETEELQWFPDTKNLQ